MKTAVRLFALAMVAVFGLNVLAAKDSAPGTAPTPANAASAVFAGGCFWCVEADFDKLAGVINVESGYTGGHTVNPSYHQVGGGRTGHTEAVRVTYDPTSVSYVQLLDYFWHHIDPTVKDQQFCDVGPQYRSAIFYASEEEHSAAEASKQALLAACPASPCIRDLYAESRRARTAEGHGCVHPD